jgi:hypothetical protein
MVMRLLPFYVFYERRKTNNELRSLLAVNGLLVKNIIWGVFPLSLMIFFGSDMPRFTAAVFP